MPGLADGLTDGRRAVLRALADIIVPRTARMPAASDIDLSGAPVDHVLRARPDLTGPLATLLDRLDTTAPAREVAQLADDDKRAFAMLMQVVAGAYYMDERVRMALGYGGQRPRSA